MKQRKINILTPSLVPHDAIGNDVVRMRTILLKSENQVRIFAEEISPCYQKIAESLQDAPRSLWTSHEHILIYHHSMGWPRGEEVLFSTKNKVILRHHNITPSYFFAPYSSAHMAACEAGRASTKRISQLPKMLVVGDSDYNCKEFIDLGIDRRRCRVLPPLHGTEELGRERFDLATLQQYSPTTVKILFVGGIKPNKGHGRAIRIFAEYHNRCNSDSRLIFAGSLDPRLSEYVDYLKLLAAELGVSEYVVFTGPVTASQLKSLYVSASVFLCTSDHEGFCVPLVEAMYFRVPIVAWGITAVPGTMGTCSTVIARWSERDFVHHLNAIVTDDETSYRLGTEGRARYLEAFAPEVLEQKLLAIIAET